MDFCSKCRKFNSDRMSLFFIKRTATQQFHSTFTFRLVKTYDGKQLFSLLSPENDCKLISAKFEENIICTCKKIFLTKDQANDLVYFHNKAYMFEAVSNYLIEIGFIYK